MFEMIKSMVAGCVAVAIGLSSSVGHKLSPDDMLSVYSLLDTPNAICSFVSDYQYEKDTGSEPYVKPSFMFLEQKKGDCKDFSNFAYECGKYNNINCKFYLMFNGTGAGHAVCVWKINKKYYPICNVTCIKKKSISGYDSIEDINKMYIKVFQWKEINYSYYAIPYPFFWKAETPMAPINKKAGDF